MMLTIYKYTIPIQDAFQLKLPIMARILCVDTQHELPCLWMMVDTAMPMTIRSFRLYGTGHPIETKHVSGLDYIGTFQLEQGAFVFHLFEDKHVSD